MSLPDSQTILVTGANGYLALHVIDQLVKNGYNVRGSVRSKKADEKVRSTFPNEYGGKVKTFFVKDLTNPEDFAGAFEDITGVIHAASPAPSNVEDAVRDMLDPAIKGATSILEAAKRYASPSFKRVVHTSSFSANLDIAKGPRAGYVYKDSDWNPITLEEAAKLKDPISLYIASKALSERAVWDWVAKQNSCFDVVSLNPSNVFGPHLESIGTLDEVRSTARLLWQLIDAKEIPELEYAGCVDVRDTAAMLVAALEAPAAGGRRFLLAHHFDWQTAADLAREALPDEIKRRIPIGKPGSGRDEAEANMYQIDGSRAADVLGVGYRPLLDTVRDTLVQLMEAEK
ncbi:NAD-dependent epimerase dehydratase [Fusarium keratoplasticum]|uniref:NAD-dependent epimerase dehydratase n=1 Tax=Fusarium keratoplasticum TaxID=1328300 RepID=A0ACC0QB68_9HYPO|nr:NAD-dependent epimerase dehydratase [Fusarium keratoplasticum]KAI8648628.1 NAD-dependent epimerase dehydratase [Fusarium keratoplasticum]